MKIWSNSMKYIINSNIEFDSAEYTLRLINRPNSLIKISGPAGRILEELIKHQNEEYPVTREHLFMTVLEGPRIRTIQW